MHRSCCAPTGNTILNKHADSSHRHPHDTRRARPRSLLLIVLLALLIGVFLLSLALGSVAIPLDEIIRVLFGGQRQPRRLDEHHPQVSPAQSADGGAGGRGARHRRLADADALSQPAGRSVRAGHQFRRESRRGAGRADGRHDRDDPAGRRRACWAISAWRSPPASAARLVLGLVLLVARRVQSSVTLLILGLMFGYGVGALVSLLLYFSIAERIQAYINWTFGSFGGVTWSQMIVFAPDDSDRAGDRLSALEVAQRAAARRNLCPQHGHERPARAPAGSSSARRCWRAR